MNFEEAILPHLDSAYTLARWLTRNPDDAQDVVQEALIRAMKYFEGFRGGQPRAWFLTIVRNTSYTTLKRRGQDHVELRDDLELIEKPEHESNPESTMMRSTHRQKVRQAIQELPIEFREVVILRELEGLDYKEISGICGVPIGTVMSRLSRARQKLQESLSELRNSI